MGFAPTETNLQKKVPFTIVKKSYFYWVGGKKGTNGFKIQIVGTFNTTNLDFHTIYFQNKELKVVPIYQNEKFTIEGGFTTLNTEDILAEELSQNNNDTPKDDSIDIPFELENDQAVLVYSINGKTFYYKISDIPKLETVYYQ
jgi:hypothetical protein